jgi:dolichyl-diphosphooligosaccharide---protein glycosyltransferase
MSFMLSGTSTLFKIGNRHFQTRHLLVVGVICIAFTTAFILRSYPLKYGFYLNEFDPYFDYRATKYIVDNGLESYFKWHDTMSWFPEGRNVPKTSQSGLHVTAAYLYKAFGGNIPLLDFTILLPVILGSLTTVVVFGLVRTLSGTTAGMFSALLFALSPAIIQRGNLGWFKSEPLGLFLGLLALYLFILAIKNHRPSTAVAMAVAGGLILGLANASWGGIQYFSIPISLFFIAVTFFRKDLTIPMLVAIAFTVATLLVAGSFPRPGMSFVAGLPGIAMIGGTIFLIVSFTIRKFMNERKFTRNNLIWLGAFIATGVGVLSIGAYQSSSFRYLNAINPFLSSQNPLVESVAEHFTPTLVDYITDYSVLLMFAGFGAWMAIRHRNDTSIFALLIGITGVYVSATFARLLVFASIGIIILAGIGLYEVTRSILAYRAVKATTIPQKTKKKLQREGTTQIPTSIRIVYVIAIIVLLALPVLDNSGIIIPPNSNWISSADIPPSIANGGTGYRLTTNDWINTLKWISTNTTSDSVVASWWDYGYWITTLGNRTSLADNATINQTRIATIAKMFMDQTENGLKIAKDLKADYILIYVVGQRFSGINGTEFYVLGSGGDESKKQWFIRIGGFDENRYLEQDGFTPTPFFWNQTLLGSLIPFTPQSYASFSNGGLTNLAQQYQPGTVALYSKDIKYPPNGGEDQPLKLVYASDSFNSNEPGLFFGVLVYQVNPNYVPKPISDPYNEKVEQGNTTSSMSQTGNPVRQGNTTASKEIALIDTAQGPITVEFFPYAAPNHVANFEQLARTGFYNDTIFHRIVDGFVIQGGDNNTKPNGKPREFWGSGGTENQVAAEFSDIPHERGIVSMARSSDPNSASSQFFIVLNDSKFLDGQYTVFGRVTKGMDVVDKIANLSTIQNDQPQDPSAARIKSISILNRDDFGNATN